MSAPLGKLLIFEVKPGGPGLAVLPDGFCAHFPLPEAGVRVCDQGQAARVIDIFYQLREGFQTQQTDVRHTPGGRQGCTGHVGRLET